ncbi:MAG TPA: hypothetical protein VGQ33_04130, partial [Vicinamibacteria bacterium]|nr:hypothetical protein [Vicinamibacteria bacterium]
QQRFTWLSARKPRACLLVMAAVAAVSCNAFKRTPGPDEATPVNPPNTASVTVEYDQVVECVAGSPRCDDNVVFFGSWMTSGEEFFLKKEPGRYIWRGTATRVPVNFPPRGDPYLVRVYDPHVVGGPTDGVTADRLKVGGEALTQFYSPGNPYESGLIYIDENGQGHTPF